MDAIVVTHNSEADLPGLFACRPLVEAFDRIVLVDNASTDGSRSLAREAEFVLHERDSNDGFGAAVNAGVRLTRGEAFMILNPDIRFTRSVVPAELARHLDDREVAIVGPSLVLPDGTIQDSAREVPTPVEIIRRRATGHAYGRIASTAPVDVPWTVAACVLVRRRAFDSVGGFDPRYFLYFEDVDLCVRLRGAGWITRFDGSVRVDHHHRAASRGGLLSWATRQHMRSALRFFLRNPRFVTRRFPGRMTNT